MTNTTHNSIELQAIGTVSSVIGTVQAQAPGQPPRILTEGSIIFANDRIITGPEGSLAIDFSDGITRLDLGRMSDMVLTEDVFQNGFPVPAEESIADIEQIQQALLTGEFDPTVDTEAPAAGPDPVENAGGGTTVVRFDLDGQEITPESGASTENVPFTFASPQAEPPVGQNAPAPVAVAAVAPAAGGEEFTPTAVSRVVEEEELTWYPEYYDTDYGDWPFGASGIYFGIFNGKFVQFEGSNGNPDDYRDTWDPEHNPVGDDDIPQDTFQPDVRVITGSLDGQLVPTGTSAFSIFTTTGLPELYSKGGTIQYEIGPDGQSLLAYVVEDTGYPPITAAFIDGPGDDYEQPEVIRPVFSLEVQPNGEYRFILYDQLDHVEPTDPTTAEENTDLQGSGIDALDFSAILSSGGTTFASGLFTIAVSDDIPTVNTDAESIGIYVYEDDLNSELVGEGDPVAGNDDLSDGTWEGDDNDTWDEEQSTYYQSVANFFNIGADEVSNGYFDDYPQGETDGPVQLFGPSGSQALGIYGITINQELLDALPTLYSQGEQVLYMSDGQTLTAYVPGSGGEEGGGDTDLAAFAAEGTEDRVIFTFRVDPDTGQWYFDLEDQLDHVDGNGYNTALKTSLGDEEGLSSLDLSSIITATDFDGDMITGAIEGSLVLQIVDDIPKVIAYGEENSVDEDDLDTALSTGTDDTDSDADGPQVTATGTLNGTAIVSGSDDPITFSFTESFTPLEQQGLTSQGQTLSYQLNESGNLEGYVSSDNEEDRVVFELQVDENGDYQFTLYDQVDHEAAEDEDDALWIDFSGVVQATDFDNDTVVLSDPYNPADAFGQGDVTNVSFRIEIVDDSPEQNPRAEVVSSTVKEDGLSIEASNEFPADFSEGNRENGETNLDDETPVVEGSIATLFNVGADEPPTFGIASNANALLADLNIKSQGHSITYQVQSVSATTTALVAVWADDTSHTVFTLEVDTDGTYRFDLDDQLDHVEPAAGNADENLDLQTDAPVDQDDAVTSLPGLDFSAILTATDFDNDTIVGAADNSFVLYVEDDIPVFTGEFVHRVVEEEALDNDQSVGNPDEEDSPEDADQPDSYQVEGSLAGLVKIGADEYEEQTDDEGPSEGPFGFVDDPQAPAGLTSQGEAVWYSINDEGVLVAYAGEAFPNGVPQTDGRESDQDPEIEARIVFTLELGNTGDYRFTLYDQLDHEDGQGENSLDLDFSSLINFTDYDGDTINLGDYEGDQALFVVTVVDDKPIVSDASGNVKEAQLTDGTAAILGAVTASGNFFDDGNITVGADEPPSIVIGGQTIVLDGNPDTDDIVINGSVSGDDTSPSYAGQLTVDSSGNWTYTLLDNTLTHPDNVFDDGDTDRDADDQVTDTFDITVLDYDNDPAQFKLNVTIDDDGPVVDLSEASGITGYVQEDALGNSTFINFLTPSDNNNDADAKQGNLDNPVAQGASVSHNEKDSAILNLNALVTDPDADVDYGADGASDGQQPTFTITGLDIPQEATGLTSQGDQIWYFQNGNTIEARASSSDQADSNGRLIFTFSINESNGLATFNLDDQLDHADASGEDGSLDITSLGQYVLYTVTDGDGDHASDTFDGLITINVENDAPVVKPASGTVKEAQLSDGTAAILGAVTASGNFFDDGNISVGADEPASITIGGQTIVLDGNPDTDDIVINGSVSGDDTSPSYAGQLTVDSSGNWTYTLLDNTLTHPDNVFDDGDGDRDADDTVTDTFAITVQDFDLDQKNFNLNITIEDDGPVVDLSDAGPITGHVHEDALGNASLLNPYNNPDPDADESGNLDAQLAPGISWYEADSTVLNLKQLVNDPDADVDYGADGASGDQRPAFTIIGLDEPQEATGLTSQGDQIWYFQNGNTIEARASSSDQADSNGRLIFTFSVNETTGWATFNLDDQLDHADASGEQGSLNITSLGQYVLYTVTDGDGDQASDTFDGLVIINVENDAPVVVNASGTVKEAQLTDGTAAILGAVTASGNFFDDGSISVGADEPASITIGGQTIVLDGNSDTDDIVINGLVSGDDTSPSYAGQLTVDSSGNWTYTLLDNTLTHPDNVFNDGDGDRDADDTVTDTFTITVQDFDLDQKVFTLNITIEDDGPVVDFSNVGVETEYVQEDALGNETDNPLNNETPDDDANNPGILDEDPSSETDVAVFNLSTMVDSAAINFGADGEGSDSYSITGLESPVLSDHTSDGMFIWYVQNGDSIEGWSSSSDTSFVNDGGLIFTFSLDTDDVTGDDIAVFDLRDQIDHQDDNNVGAGDDGSLDIDDLGQYIQYTATDGDGDTASATFDGKIVINVENDVPEALPVTQVPENLNLVLILDTSGSMREGGSNLIQWTDTGGSTSWITRAAALQLAVEGALATMEASAADNIRIHVVTYNDDAPQGLTFDLKSGGVVTETASSIAAAIADMDTGTYTNYEAGLASALDWTDGNQSTEPLSIAGVQNQVIFISDGDPNTWNTAGGTARDMSESGMDYALLEATSTTEGGVPGAGVNEFGELSDWADSINAVGIQINDSDSFARLNVLDTTPDGAENINDANGLIDILPQLITTTIPIISVSVEEDDLNNDILTVPDDDPDNATGNNEDNTFNADEDDTYSLTSLFRSGADEELSFSMLEDDAKLPILYSGGQQITYSFSNNTLTAKDYNNEVVFTFSIAANGAYHFDLDGALDHVDDGTDSENYALVSGVDGQSSVVGIDLSSIIIATDADFDSVPATDGAFVVEVQDDIPAFDAENIQYAILANEDGNMLTANLAVDFGADGPAEDDAVKITGPVDSDGFVINNAGLQMTSGGEKLVYVEDGEGGLIAVRASDQNSQDPDSVAVFKVTLNHTAGVYNDTYSVEILDTIDGREGVFFDFTSYSGPNPGVDEALKLYSDSNGVLLKVTGTSPDGDNIVNTSKQGMGVDSNSVDNADTPKNNNPDTEHLFFEFFDANGTNPDESDDSVLYVDRVGFTIDHLDQQSSEQLYWTIYYENGGTETGTVDASGQGASNTADQSFFIINGSGTDDGTNFYVDDSFYKIELTAADGTSYRVLNLSIEEEGETFDNVITYQVEATDFDGDTVYEELDVTFDGDDIIQGTDADEVISGASGGVGSTLSGNSVIDGGGGNDIIFGNAGDDTLIGSSGNDVLVGGTGEDTLYGDDGNDNLVGEGITYDEIDGEYDITGDAQDDKLYGGSDTDQALPDDYDGLTDGGVEGSDVDLDTLIPSPDGE